MSQLRHVLTFGIYLAQRRDNVTGGVNLYYVPGKDKGFFAEVGIDEAQGCFVVVRSFVHTEPLEEYAGRVRLPGE